MEPGTAALFTGGASHRGHFLPQRPLDAARGDYWQFVASFHSPFDQGTHSAVARQIGRLICAETSYTNTPTSWPAKSRDLGRTRSQLEAGRVVRRQPQATATCHFAGRFRPGHRERLAGVQGAGNEATSAPERLSSLIKPRASRAEPQAAVNCLTRSLPGLEEAIRRLLRMGHLRFVSSESSTCSGFRSF